jgi:hypothetical protein
VSVEGINNLIGGTIPGAGNVIAGGETGVRINSMTSVQGNYIGTLADGVTAAGCHDFGVRVDGSTNVVGGAESGSANIIAFNQRTGVGVTAGSNNLILGNSIFGNNESELTWAVISPSRRTTRETATRVQTACRTSPRSAR